MMATVKDFVSNIGCGAQDLAGRVGSSSARVARRVGKGSTKLAHRGVDLAHRIGPKKGIVGLLIAGGAIAGAVVLVRYLRARAEEVADDQVGDDVPPGKLRNKRKRAMNAHAAMH